MIKLRINSIGRWPGVTVLESLGDVHGCQRGEISRRTRARMMVKNHGFDEGIRQPPQRQQIAADVGMRYAKRFLFGDFDVAVGLSTFAINRR